MTAVLSKFLPLILITVGVVVGVEGFYVLADRFLSQPHQVSGHSTQSRQISDDPVSEKAPGKTENLEGDRPKPSIIIRRNLFGALTEPADIQQEQVIDIGNLEASKLQVVLLGTVMGGADASRAIILTKDGYTQEIYQEGDYIQGALIRKITRRNVILSHNGRDEYLDMNESHKYAPKVAAKPAPVSPAVMQAKAARKTRTVTARSVSATAGQVQQADQQNQGVPEQVAAGNQSEGVE